ncbi:hypothetical protein [Mucisphaera calidilacus]|nr:hypothetical protein [Mucisphaera calidilacus]
MICTCLSWSNVQADIPIDPEATTQAEYDERYRIFFRTMMVDAYLETGRRSARWDNQAERGLIEAAQYWASRPWVRHGAWASRIVDDLSAAIEAGCDDPLVLYTHARLLTDDPRTSVTRREGNLMLLDLVAATDEQGYAPLRVWLVAKNAHQGSRRAYPAAPNTEALLIRAIEAAEAVLQSTESGHEQFIARWMDDWFGSLNLEELRIVHAELKGVEDVGPWLRETTLGALYIELAWGFRGGGWADEVTEGGWEGFHNCLALARKHLKKAWSHHRSRPEPAALMIKVSLGAPERDAVSEMRLWFERAVRAQFDYEAAYSSYEWGIRPRWHGSIEAIEAFGHECLETGRFDTIVPFRYIKSMRTVRDELVRRDPSYRWAYDARPETYERTRAVLEGYLNSPPYEFDREGLLLQLAGYATVAERHDEVIRVAGLLGELPNGVDPISGKHWVEVLGTSMTEAGPEKEELRRARLLLSSGRQSDAATIYTSLAVTAESKTMRAFYRKRVVTLDWYGQFMENLPVAVTPDEALTGWEPVQGSWSSDGERLIGDSRGGYLQVRMFGSYGDYWQLSGRAQVLEAPETHRRPLVVVGRWDGTPLGVIMDAHRKEVSVGELSSRRMLVRVPAVDDDFRFRIQFRKGQIHIWIDEELVVQNAWFSGYEETHDNRPGVGGYYWDQPARISFSDLELHRLMP